MITSSAFFLVLSSALLHATWNSLVKTTSKKSLNIFLISVSHLIFGVVLSFFSIFPPLEAWPYIIISAIVHAVYLVFLYNSYRLGDLSEVYPLMRGTAPLLVTIGAFVFANEFPQWIGLIGILFVSFGIILLSLHNFFFGVSFKAIIFAILTGVCITGYTLLDGLGAREAKYFPCSNIVSAFL